MGKRPAGPTVTPDQAVVTLHGASREIYGFTPFPLDAPPAIRGVFALAAPAGEDAGNAHYWRLLFVGEAADIAGAAADWLAEARKVGASRLLVHICSRDEDYRRFIEEDLVAAFDPPLNALQRRAAAA